MDINELLTTLGAMYDSGSKTLKFDPSQFDTANPNIKAMFLALYPGLSTVEVTSVEQAPAITSPTTVNFSGQLAEVLKLPNNAANFNFALVNQKPVWDLEVPLTFDWKFTDSFSELSTEDFWTNIRLRRFSNPTALQTPFLIVVSDNYQDPARGVALVPTTQNFLYVNFWAALDWQTATFPMLSWLLPALNETAAFGGIQWALISGTADNEWVIDIIVASTTVTGIFDVDLPISLHLVRTATQAYLLSQSGIEVEATINLSSGPIYVTAIVGTETSKLLALNIDLSHDKLSLPSPADLLRFLGDPSVGSQMPAQFQGGLGVHLSRMEFGFSMDSGLSLKQRLAYASIELTAMDESGLLTVIETPSIQVGNLTFTFSSSNPLDSATRQTNFVFTGELDIAGVPFDVTARLPNFTIAATLQEGHTIQLGALIHSLIGEVPDLGLEITYLNLSATPKPFRQFFVQAEIYDVLTIDITDNIIFGIERIYFEINNTTAGTTGELNGTVDVAGVDFDVSASHPEPGGDWIFKAGLTPGAAIDLSAILNKFFAAVDAPFFPAGLQIIQLDVSLTKPPKAKDPKDQVRNSYSFDGALAWNFDLTESYKIDTTATVNLAWDGTKPENQAFSGKVAANIQVPKLGPNASLTIFYDMLKDNTGQPNNSLGIALFGFQGVYSFQEQTATITVENWSVGELISGLIGLVTQDRFELPPPWNLLNDLSLNGFKIIITMKKGSEAVEVDYQLPQSLDLGFIRIDSIGFVRRSGASGVNLRIQGSSPVISPSDPLFSKPGQDLQNLPAVPGKGNKYLDLKYLGLGQHVALYPTAQLDTVEAATTALKNVFEPPAPIVTGTPPLIPIFQTPLTPPVNPVLIFDESSDWLIGTQFTVMETVSLSIIFNDPNLYGLLIELSGPRAKSFGGLKFEILYKKITNTIGVYEIDLQLPTAMRHMEFGEVSITLPNISLSIYTNGNFKVDVGFPVGLDFSGSFTLQAFPFTGSGGFYFAVLDSATSPQVPVSTVGSFNPVIAFGLGLQLGIGKDVSEGILSAGLSLTAIGVFEGAIGFYVPNDDSYPGKGDHYYWLQATLALVGRVYGEINFAIISARLDIVAYASIRATVESYMAIPIDLEAGISVSLSVKINLGLFSFTIHCSFSATIHASFSIGTSHPQDAPWNYIPPPFAPLLSETARRTLTSTTMKWQPLILTEAEKQLNTMNVYFLPTLTISGELRTTTQQTQMVGMFYTDAPTGPNPTTATSLNSLATGVLAWSINAYVNSSKTETTWDDLIQSVVGVDDLEIILCYLTHPPTNVPVAYRNAAGHDIASFLANYFGSFNIIGLTPDSPLSIDGSVFPAIPDLTMTTAFTGDPSRTVTIDFSKINPVGKDYQDAIQKEFAAMAVEYQSALEKSNDDEEIASDICRQVTDPDVPPVGTQFSMPTFLFQDYVLLLARSTLQDAIDSFKKYVHPCGQANTLDSIVTLYTDPPLDNSLTKTELSVANQMAALNAGVSLAVPGIVYQVSSGQTLQKIVDFYNQGLPVANQLSLAQYAFGANLTLQNLIPPGTSISIAGVPTYTVVSGDTLASITHNINAGGGAGATVTAGQVIAAAPQAVPPLLAPLDVPALTYVTGENDTLGGIATLYGVALANIAEAAANGSAGDANGNLFVGPTIQIPNLLSLEVGSVLASVNTVDSIARVAGMSSRFFLHGLRLPAPDSIQSHGPGDADASASLYELTGQQVGLTPVNPPGPLAATVTVTLTNSGSADWITFQQGTAHHLLTASPNLSLELDAAEVSRINDLMTIRLNPDTSPLPPSSLPLYQDSPLCFSLKAETKWQYPGNLTLPIGTPVTQRTPQPTIWPFSDPLMDRIQSSGGADLDLVLKVSPSRQVVNNYAWATLVKVDIKKVAPQPGTTAPIFANACNVVGADDTGIVFLERLLSYMNQKQDDSFIDQIQILYSPSATATNAGGLQSEANGELQFALVQANLSTETNPTAGTSLDSRRRAVNGAPARNTINTYHDFVALLWECSIVRSGGFYLYYATAEGNNGLPGSLYNENLEGSISLLVTYKAEISQSFVNCAVMTDPIDTAQSLLYVECEAFTQRCASVPPGNVGVRATRTVPPDYEPVVPYPIPANAQATGQDTVYLERLFNLLGFTLQASPAFRQQPQALMPIGAAESQNGDAIDSLRKLPRPEDATKPWAYQSMVPVARHATSYLPSPDSAFPPAEEDPYAGIGGQAIITLNWQDMYGNIVDTPMSASDVVKTVSYIDPIIGVDAWPSVSARYSFSAGPALDIDLHFGRTRYTPDSATGMTPEQAAQNARIDAVTYARIYYQLRQLDVEVFFNSSLTGANLDFPVASAQMVNYVGAIYKYLTANRASGIRLPIVPDPFRLSQPIDPSKVVLDDILELQVQLTIRRTANIDPDFQDVPSVQIATALVKPKTLGGSLRDFAFEFETVFADKPVAGVLLKIAVGLDRADVTNNTSSNKRVWVVRFDPAGQFGMSYAISAGQPAYYAPVPLSTSLQNYHGVTVNNYISGQPYPASTSIQNFSDIDLDNWGRLALEAIDQVLSPELAVPAFLIDDGVTLRKILDSKQTLAEAIEGTMTTIIDSAGGTANIGNAQEVFKQQLLIQLSNAYRINAVVQSPVTIQSEYQGSNDDPPPPRTRPTEPITPKPYVPRLYGNMIGKTLDAEANSYTLSNAKVPLGSGRSWLTYLFTARNAAMQSSFSFSDLRYTVSHIEHQIADVPDMGHYQASAWLSFVVPLPDAMGEIGPVEIPVPLRSYPIPPSIVGQQALYAQDANPTQETTITDAKTWGYEFTYQQAEASQDIIKVQVDFGVPHFLLGSEVPSQLPMALAQFAYSYKAIQQDLATALTQVNATTQTQSPKVFATAQYALSAFQLIVADIARLWLQWNQLNPRNPARRSLAAPAGSNLHAMQTLRYMITETEAVAGDPASDLLLTVEAMDGGIPDYVPQVRIPDYLTDFPQGAGGRQPQDIVQPPNVFRFYQIDDSGKRVYLSYADRAVQNQRGLTLPGLDILQQENAWSGIYITRNEELLKKEGGGFQQTDGHFIYQTPLIRYRNQMIPLLACVSIIDIAEANQTGSNRTPVQLPLAQHLCNLFIELFSGENAAGMLLKLECQYEYVLDGATPFAAVSLPICLAAPFAFDPSKDLLIGVAPFCESSNSGFVCDLTRTIKQWFSDHLPQTNQGRLLFKLDVYASNESKLPLLTMSQLILQTDLVTDLEKSNKGGAQQRRPRTSA